MIGRFLRSLGIRADERPAPTPSQTSEAFARARAGIADRLATSADIETALALAFVESEGARMPQAWGAASNDERLPFARAWMSLSLDNERLAPRLQLTSDEIAAPFRLLESFFFGSSNMQAEAQDVLRFIEGRFASGYFSQARLLLQLFETDATTWRNNERNLAQEEVTHAVTSSRRRPVTAEMRAEFDLVAAQAIANGMAGLRMLAAWYAARCDVRFHVYSRDLSEVAAWGESLVAVDATAREQVLDIVPPWCWRPIDLLDVDPFELYAGHAAATGVHNAIRHLTRTMYFIALMPGRTGFEPLLVQWMRWGNGVFDAPVTRVLPDIHRRTVVLEQRLELALDAVSEAWMSRHSYGDHFDASGLEEAAHRVVERLTSVDPSMIPEGDYDIGGLVLDELLGFRPQRVTDALRLHRLL